MKKITDFEGYVSGDYDCFCLCKIPFKQWKRLQDFHRLTDNQIRERMKYLNSIMLYPGDFFPKEIRDKKCKFKITVEAEIIGEDGDGEV